MKAVRVHAIGGPEALIYEDLPDPKPEAGQVIVRVEAVGVNFAEIYTRRGQTPANLPTTIGIEAAGTVVEVGPDVSKLKAGDRVAVNGVPGCYSELLAAPESRAIKLSDNISTKQAAASLLQGMTAHYLAVDTYPLKAGDTCLVHAAAGGVGLLLTQIARQKGARVIGTVSTEEKAQAAREAGADEVILYTKDDFEAEVKRLTDSKGVEVVYDSVGKDTFIKGFNVLKPRGYMVLYGASSGQPDPVDIGLLNRGSFFVTRPTLVHHSVGQELQDRGGEVFDWVGSGKLKVRVHSEYPLSEAVAAQAALENRETIGKVLLIP
jgi:NADPH:quinone reductase